VNVAVTVSLALIWCLRAPSTAIHLSGLAHDRSH
jgi:hypothetical protein